MMYGTYVPYGQQNSLQFQQGNQQNMQQYPQFNQQYMQQNSFAKPNGLLGKSVDSIDVVRAMDIPLDGSISYFPLTDGTAIVTKQLQNDGTSKTLIYKLTSDNIENTPKYATMEDLKKAIDEIDLDDIKDDIKSLKKQIKGGRNKDDD